MGDSSILKLVIEKGPRGGETLEFRPGSIIRLGRVVRGNSVTIKDSGISTKHLEIHFQNDSGKWVITDLGSSNGTFLNDNLIDANMPVCLSNNDVLKLGEVTLIVVNICDDVAVLRSSRRKGVGESGVGGVGEVGLVDNVVEKPKRGRGRKAKVGLSDEVEKGVVDEIGGGKGNENQGRQLRSRVTRNAVMEQGGKVEDFGKQLESLAAIEGKMRKGRGKKKVVDEEAEKEVVQERMEFQEEDVVKDLPEKVLHQDIKDSMINEFSDNLGVEHVLETKDGEHKDEGPGVKNGNVDLRVEPDLEKMTLGEWFDFLEVYLPKKIHDETEELISNMKKRAKQFHEYTVQQKRAMGKGKSPMA